MTKPVIDTQALAAAGPWIDTHCHLTMDDHPSSTHDDASNVVQHAEPIIAAAREAGVERLITIATDLASAQQAIAIANVYDNVWATVGLHPHDATNGVAGLAELVTHPKVVAIGECGLDYYYEHSPREVQRDVFAVQIELAKQHDVALVIHTRDAWVDTFAILDDTGIPEHTIIHCFSGGQTEAEQCVARGAYLSFSGIATFPKAPEVQEAAMWCPLDRLLIETDSPFLAPVPFRGKPNQPAWVTVVGAAIAQARGVEPSQIADAVWRNAATVFDLRVEDD